MHRRVTIALAALAIVSTTVAFITYSSIIGGSNESTLPFRKLAATTFHRGEEDNTIPITFTTTPEDEQLDVLSKADLVSQFKYEKHLQALSNPLEELKWCSDPDRSNKTSNIVVSQNGFEGTMARLEFSGFGSNGPARYNLNMLPYPPSAPAQYIAFARQSPISDTDIVHHEIVYCDMDWSKGSFVARTKLECVTPVRVLNFDEFDSPKELCVTLEGLHIRQGQLDPRVFFSPKGEPLMIFGSNGHENCLMQYIIDLRAVIPDLGLKLGVSHLPIVYNETTPLPREKLQEIEKNWFLVYDEDENAYVHHDLVHRSITPLEPIPNVARAHPNIAQSSSTTCLTSLLSKSNDENQETLLHQGTNSLRVTLCKFPCVPTIHNTALMHVFHIKYRNFLEVYYRRYVVLMNVTAPFDIIGRTNNIVYTGTDEKTMVYSVSMAWDHEHFRDRRAWVDAIADSGSAWDDLEPAEAPEPAKILGHSALVNKYYHGWIDDVLVINLGIDDDDVGIMHVKAKNLLDCIITCG
ncbi:hypothetical protein V1514DRAFT_277816 [Lipomyces japonicus]|uniref:uncharacterized protein n=1 Tax=Lipomyces japonicus TaxID=56871 RepID=UPI0034CD4D47